MTIRICREVPLFNFERLDELCPRIGHPCEKLWPFEFLECFRCSISSVSKYYVPESDICVKRYDHSNFSRASVVQFLASRYIMSLNQTSEWNVMTTRICRVLPLFNFERLDELSHRIGHPCEKLWPFEFVECFRCSISSVSIFYVLESDIGVKCYDHLNLLRASVVQFRTSRYIMSPNRTSVWRVMTIRISRQLPLFNFERLDILCPRIDLLCEKLGPFETASVVQFWASRYIMSPNRSSVWKVRTIRIAGQLPLFNFERLDILCPQIGLLCEKLGPFEFLDSFRCSISSVSRYYVPESDICVKSYYHSNFSRASVVQFLASRYIMYPNQTSEWNVMTIRICRELPFFNFQRLDEICHRIRHPCEKLWAFEFVESFRCSNSSV